MKIIQYCQHVLGVGHVVRTLEISKAMAGHEIVLVNGGAPFEFPLPPHVREHRLPVLMMDAEFKGLITPEKGRTVEEVKSMRGSRLFDLIAAESPDLFIVELFPFGRRSFAFEIEPVLRAIRERRLPACYVACSLRDILVERTKNWDAYEKEVVNRLNAYFDALIIHADPGIIRLEETFSKAAEIKIPVFYSGFVAQRIEPGARLRIRRSLNLSDGGSLLVASIGGGKVGFPLLQAVITAFQSLSPDEPDWHLVLFTGPFMEEEAFQVLYAQATSRVEVLRFSTDFPSYLAAADLSVSMAGYNTCMNILAAKIPALLFPFNQNREQRMRAERLKEIGAVEILEECDLERGRLIERIRSASSKKWRISKPVELEGALQSARWLIRRAAG
ncbi:MAG: glycosyl transferase [Desulfobacteraceae bacterium]|nr:MAG: glycosyl transferase [Desulfobacteraceae bacterium]